MGYLARPGQRYTRTRREIAGRRENPNAVKQRAYEDIRAALSDILGGGGGSGTHQGAEGSGDRDAEAPHAQRDREAQTEEADSEERQLSKTDLEDAGENRTHA
jgi:hypothetical protein